jgi:hypothetical protein
MRTYITCSLEKKTSRFSETKSHSMTNTNYTSHFHFKLLSVLPEEIWYTETKKLGSRLRYALLFTFMQHDDGRKWVGKINRNG